MWWNIKYIYYWFLHTYPNHPHPVLIFLCHFDNLTCIRYPFNNIILWHSNKRIIGLFLKIVKFFANIYGFVYKHYFELVQANCTGYFLIATIAGVDYYYTTVLFIINCRLKSIQCIYIQLYTIYFRYTLFNTAAS